MKKWRKKYRCPYCDTVHFVRNKTPKNTILEKEACKECEYEERCYREDVYRNAVYNCSGASRYLQ